MRFLVLLLFLTACSSEGPGRFYVQSINMPTPEAEKVEESIVLMNSYGASISKIGSRPITVVSASLPGLSLSRAVPRAYGCSIEIDTTNSLIVSDPDLIKLIFAHELGHCLGLDYSYNPGEVMYYSITGSYGPFWENKIKDFGQIIKDLL